MMAAAAAVVPDPVDQVETLLICSICLEIFKEPRTLPCHHSFCKLCLTKFVGSQRKQADAGKKVEIFHCPDCRTEFPLKSNEDVEGMGSSHFIRNMLEVLTIQRQVKEKTTKCSRCHEPATCRCSSCVMFMCKECHQSHESWPANKKHSVLSLSEMSRPENQGKLLPKPSCKKHKKEMKFFCETCQELICKYCMDFKHARSDHLCHPLADVAEKEREVLETHCQFLQQYLDNGHKALKSFSHIQQTLEDNAKKAKDEIHQQKNDIVKTVVEMLEEKAKRLSNEVDAKYKEPSEALLIQEAEVKEYMDKVEGPLMLARNLLENGSDEEIVSSQKLVKENVKKLQKDQVLNAEDMTPVHDGHIEYEKKISEHEVKEFIGKLTDNLGNTECTGVPCEFKLRKMSTILNNQPGEYTQQLHQWLDGQLIWQCCYRASRDGWRADDFHRHCNGVGPTMTLVKVGDYIFGGYTDQDWEGDDVFKSSQTSFLFSLRNKDSLLPFKAPLNPNQQKYAIYSGQKYGAVFGKGNDLFIHDNSDANCFSHTTEFGETYESPAGYVWGNQRTRSLLAGSCEFTPDEIEVYI